MYSNSKYIVYSKFNIFMHLVLLTFHLTLDKSSNINDKLIVNYIATILDYLWIALI